jgi:N-acetylmuramoyl-L-alanine amidase
MTVFRVSVALLSFAAMAAEPAQLKSIRTWSQPEVTRVIVELTAASAYKHGRLSNPPRAYVDLLGASLELQSAPGKKYAVTAVGDSRVHRVRAAENAPGVTRLVFDLTSDGTLYTVSELENPSRVVVELRAGTAPTAAPAVVIPRISMDQMREEAQRAAATGKVAAPPVSRVEAPPVAAKTSSPLVAQAATVAHAGTTPSYTAAPVYTPPAAPDTPLVITPPVGEPAHRASRSLTRALGLKLGKIVIDPGHGGHDLGTTSPGGLHEKDLVLDVSLRLAALLEEKLGAQVVLTRTTDTFVSLERRTDFANQQRADLFISVHANSSPVPSVAGPETFFLNFSSARDSLEVAARENAVSGKTIFELQDLLKKIALNDKLTESREFATRVQAALMENAQRNGPRVRDRGVKRAPFVVLIGAAMPSILTELGFVTNEREEALMQKPEYRQRLAEALAKGVTRYASTLSRFQVASSGSASGSEDR